MIQIFVEKKLQNSSSRYFSCNQNPSGLNHLYTGLMQGPRVYPLPPEFHESILFLLMYVHPRIAFGSFLPVSISIRFSRIARTYL